MSNLIGPAERKNKVRPEEAAGGWVVKTDRENLTAFILEADPIQMTPNMIDGFLEAAVNAKASDISIKSDDLTRVEISGVYYNATRRPWSSPEVDEIMAKIFGSSNARTEINSLKEIDVAYEIQMSNGERQRFRVNITGAMGVNEHGVEISMRSLPRVTPSKEDVGLGDAELAAMMPKDGIVIIAGGTGHGKSTTMAAVIQEHLRSRTAPVKIIDIQHPVEYTFRDVMKDTNRSSSFIVQMGIGVNIRSFAAGVRASLRKKPSIISVGEARDSETIAASIEGSLTGHLVYTTTHASSVGETIQRLLSRFEGADRESKAIDLCSSLRFIMVQNLVERVDVPGRIAVREYLRITERIRERMARLPLRDWPQYLTDEVNGKIEGSTKEDLRMSMRESASKAFNDGKISKANALSLSRLINYGKTD